MGHAACHPTDMPRDVPPGTAGELFDDSDRGVFERHGRLPRVGHKGCCCGGAVTFVSTCFNEAQREAAMWRSVYGGVCWSVSWTVDSLET